MVTASKRDGWMVGGTKDERRQIKVDDGIDRRR